MRDVLKRSDIERARQELDARRTAMLKRHEAEIAALDASREEIELLGRLAEAFARKFPRPAAAPRPPARAPEIAVQRQAAPTTAPPARAAAKPRERAPVSGPAFKIFSRAVAESSF
jgi:hypothetical protein